MIYLNCAASAYKRPDCVGKAMLLALELPQGLGRSNLSGTSVEKEIFSCREKILSFVDAPQGFEAIFCSGATEALNMAIFGLLEPGDKILLGEDAHNAALRPAYAITKDFPKNCLIYAIQENGLVDINQYNELLKEKPKLVVITAASNVTGQIQDYKYLCELAHQSGALVLIDAAQLVGSRVFSLKDSGADLLALPAHKALLGPSGLGILIFDTKLHLKPRKFGGTGFFSDLKDMPHSYPEHLEAGTANIPGIFGLSAALDFLNAKTMQEIEKAELEKLNLFAQGLAELQHNQDCHKFSVLGSYKCSYTSAQEHASLFSISPGNKKGSDCLFALSELLSQKHGLIFRTGLHCAPLIHKRLQAEAGSLRLSFDFFTTKEELALALSALKESLEALHENS